MSRRVLVCALLFIASGLAARSVDAGAGAVRVRAIASAPSVAAAAAERPTALASADFDEDGVADVATAVAAADEGGRITILLGNVEALWPHGRGARVVDVPAFRADAVAVAVSIVPDFLVAADVDADGHADLVLASRGGDSLVALPGDGRGGFGAPRQRALPGGVTALATSDVDRRDGLPDLVVGIAAAARGRVIVLEGPEGAWRSAEEIVPVDAPPTSFAFGGFASAHGNDVAVAAGDALVVIAGRDRRLTAEPEARAAVPPPAVRRQALGYAVRAVAATELAGVGGVLAALDGDGVIHYLALPAPPPAGRTLALTALPEHARPAASAAATRAVAAAPFEERASSPSGAAADARPAGETARPLRELGTFTVSAAERTRVHDGAILVATHFTAGARGDLVVVDPARGRLAVVGERSAEAAARAPTPGAPGRVALLASVDLPVGAPVAVLPMRLAPSPLERLVVLGRDDRAPLLVEPAAVATFTVTTTSDSGPGSFRQAIKDANATDGESRIVFDLPISDPGRDPVTGAFVFEPLLDPSPGFYSTLLPHVLASTITIDGYSQPGAHPNTLAAGDDAMILIRIHGTHQGPGSVGLRFAFNDAVTVRGLAITGFTMSTPVPGAEGAYGGWGIDFDAPYGFVEGNFVGVDETGTTAGPNAFGVMISNAGFASWRHATVGGTTPPARNVVSGNVTSNIGVFPNGFGAVIAGNFIGTNASGTAAVGTTSNGFVTDSSALTIGGTVPGAGNVIAGSAINVDVNDLLSYGIVEDNLVQGNRIGTDPTGTKKVAGSYTGIAITSGPSANTVGGTTAAARNVIAGNALWGMWIGAAVTDTIIQGNYVGVDASGVAALGNGDDGIFHAPVDVTTEVAPVANTIGGAVASAGNVIAGNGKHGLEIVGSARYGTDLEGSVVYGNRIGVGADGTTPLPNAQHGILLGARATNNVIGAVQNGLGNVIARNGGDGIRIDPGPSAWGDDGRNDAVRGNAIFANGGAGVRVASGVFHPIQGNAIHDDGGLGIDLDPEGPNAVSACNESTSGPNQLQNAPVLTAGGGGTFVTATATDPSGNTSELSNCVAATVTGTLANLVGTLEGNPSTTYAIEWFANDACDGSGHGEGQRLLCRRTVTTGADCHAVLDGACDVAKADLGVTLGGWPGTHPLDAYAYTAVVTNHGAVDATNVVLTGTLPVNGAPTGATATQGACDLVGQAVTCALGMLPSGLTATVTIDTKTLDVGPIATTVTVAAAQADPEPANDTATMNIESTYAYPIIESFVPASATVGSPALALLVKGVNFLPVTTVAFKGTALAATLEDGLVCGGGVYREFPCRGLHVVVPASLLTTVGYADVQVTNPEPGGGTTRDYFLIKPEATATATATPTATAALPTATPTRTPTPLRTRTPTPIATRTPAPEDCFDCIDDDFDGAVDRDDSDCPPRADGAELGMNGPPDDAKAITKCAKALGKAGTKLAAATVARLAACVDAAFTCVQAKPGDAACLAKATTGCAKRFTKAPADEAKLRAAVAKACGAPGVDASALRSIVGLGYTTEVPVCGERGVPALDSAGDVADCLVAQHECRAANLVAAAAPRAAELLRLLGRDPVAELPCLGTGVDGAGVGLGTIATKGAVGCQKAIGKASAKFAATTAKGTHACLGAMFACIQTKPTDAACLAKATAACRKRLAKLAAPGQGAGAKLAASVAKACTKAPLIVEDLLGAEGLGFAGLQGTCSALAVPALDSVDALATCLERAYACRVRQLLDVEMPRAAELLDAVP